MTELHDLLQRAAPEPRRPVDIADLDRRAARQRTRTRALAGVSAVLVVAAVLTIGLTQTGSERDGRVDTAGNGEPTPPQVSDDHDEDSAAAPDTDDPAPSPKASATEPTITSSADTPKASEVGPSGQRPSEVVTLTDAERDTEASPFAVSLTSRQPEPALDIVAAQLRSDPASGTLTTHMELADLSDTAPPGADGARYEWRTTLVSPTRTIDLVIEVQRYNDDQYVRFVTYAGPDIGEILPCGPSCDIYFDALNDTVSVAIPGPAVEQLLRAVSIGQTETVTLTGLSAQTVWIHTTRDANSCAERDTRTDCSGPYANAPADNAQAAGEPAITVR